jgi:hypothetical protein
MPKLAKAKTKVNTLGQIDAQNGFKVGLMWKSITLSRIYTGLMGDFHLPIKL